MAVVGRRYAISGEGYSTVGQITHVGGKPDVPLDKLLLPMALCADAEVKDGAPRRRPDRGCPRRPRGQGRRRPDADPRAVPARRRRCRSTRPTSSWPRSIACRTTPARTSSGRTSRARRTSSWLAPPTAHRTGRHRGPDRPGPRPLPGRERAPRRAGPAGHGHRPARLRPGHVRPERGPAAARQATSQLLALVGIVDPPRPEARVGDREGPRGRHPGPDDHRRPRGHRRRPSPASSASWAGPSPAPSSPRCPTNRPIARDRRHRRHRPGRARGQGPPRRHPAQARATSSR